MFIQRICAFLLAVTSMLPAASACAAAATPAPTLAPVQAHGHRLPIGEAVPYGQDTETLRVVVAQLGARDCFVVTCGGESVLIDCGTKDSAYQLSGLIRSLGISRFKYALSTHPHDDHMSGFFSILAEFPTPTLYTRFQRGYNNQQKRLVREISRMGIAVETLTEATDLNVGGAVIRWYDRPKAKTTNDRSLVVHIQFGERSLLLTADVSQYIQRRLIELNGAEAFRADILKLPHHGIDKPSLELLAAAQPSEVFFTYQNVKATHPTVDMLRKLGFQNPLFSGDGTLVFTTDGGNLWYVQQMDKLMVEVK